MPTKQAGKEVAEIPAEQLACGEGKRQRQRWRCAGDGSGLPWGDRGARVSTAGSSSSACTSNLKAVTAERCLSGEARGCGRTAGKATGTGVPGEPAAPLRGALRQPPAAAHLQHPVSNPGCRGSPGAGGSGEGSPAHRGPGVEQDKLGSQASAPVLLAHTFIPLAHPH